jgi:hypothetical protein
MGAWLQAALAGGAAAAVWALQEPLDQRAFRFGYSDVALLGKLVTRGPHWRAVGFAVHVGNGVVFGLVVWALHEWLGGDVFWLAVAAAMVEHVLTYPLTLLTDRYHPARGAPELPPMARSWRAFGQATYRHLLFGVVLGLLLSI